jgi:hypothetical protein
VARQNQGAGGVEVAGEGRYGITVAGAFAFPAQGCLISEV